METHEDVPVVAVILIPTACVLISVVYQFYQFVNFYPVLGIYCTDSAVRDRACSNLISLTICSTIGFQLSVGAICSILIKQELLPFTVFTRVCITLAAVLYLIIWNLMLIHAITVESKCKLGLCWSTMVTKLTFLSYLIIKTSSLIRVSNDDLFIFGLLIMCVVAVFLDAIILCRTIMALNMFDRGFSSKVTAAREASKIKQSHSAEEGSSQPQARPLSAILLP